MEQMNNSEQKDDLLPLAHHHAKPMLGAVRFRTIEHFPKNKEITNVLSNEQISIRQNVLKVEQDEFTCKKCSKTMPISEFYLKDKLTKRRSKSCRDCQIKLSGVLEVGKTRFAKKILKKGFRRCSVCKSIKPITEYKKSKNAFGGYSNNCYDCSNELHSKFLEKQKSEIGDFYIRQYGLRKGVTEFDNSMIEKLKNEIIESRKPILFIDKKEFTTIADFAKYMNLEYKLDISRTEKRIQDGATEIECKIDEYEYRRLKSGTNKGQIKVLDTITNEVFLFFNTREKGLLKMFSTDSISKGLKSGIAIGGKRSKYPNPCIISRV